MDTGTEQQSVEKTDNWNTAVRYQMYHGLAFIALGGMGAGVSSGMSRRCRRVMTWSFVLGLVLFSGCLYLWVLTDWRPLVRLVPVGGISFLVGWTALILGAAQAPRY